MIYPEFTIKEFMQQIMNGNNKVKQLSPDQELSIFSDLIIYITGFCLLLIFAFILCIFLCIPKLKEFAKSRLKSIKEKLVNSLTRSLNISWLETSSTAGS